MCINHTQTPLFCTQADRVANKLVTTVDSCGQTDSGAAVSPYGKHSMNRNIGSIGTGIGSHTGSASISACPTPTGTLDECVRLPFRPSTALAIGDNTTCRRLLPWIRSLTTSPEAPLALHAFARFDIVLNRSRA